MRTKEEGRMTPAPALEEGTKRVEEVAPQEEDIGRIPPLEVEGSIL